MANIEYFDPRLMAPEWDVGFQARLQRERSLSDQEHELVTACYSLKRERVYDARRDGLSERQIAELYGVPPRTQRRWLEKYEKQTYAVQYKLTTPGRWRLHTARMMIKLFQDEKFLGSLDGRKPRGRIGKALTAKLVAIFWVRDRYRDYNSEQVYECINDHEQWKEVLKEIRTEEKVLLWYLSVEDERDGWLYLPPWLEEAALALKADLQDKDGFVSFFLRKWLRPVSKDLIRRNRRLIEMAKKQAEVIVLDQIKDAKAKFEWKGIAWKPEISPQKCPVTKPVRGFYSNKVKDEEMAWEGLLSASEPSE